MSRRATRSSANRQEQGLPASVSDAGAFAPHLALSLFVASLRFLLIGWLLIRPF